MKIDILISTYNEGIYKVKNLLMVQDSDINYIVSHQVTKPKMDFSDCIFLNRPDVKYFQLNKKGISKNRNNTLLQSSGDICFIADDDVIYDILTIKDVARHFDENPELDLFIGKIKTYEGEAEYKTYSASERVLSWKDIGSVSSIEMVVKRDSIVNNNIRFDERFGLGSNLYQKGEEAVFLSDCLKNKLKIKFFPQYIVKHHKESSASSVEYDDKETEYMGALSYRIFRNKAFGAGVLFCLKHYSRYNQFLSPFEYLRYFHKGIINMKKYSTTNKNRFTK